MMKAYKLNIVLFILVIFSLATVNALNTDKPKISMIEKRVLKPMPEFSLSTLTEGVFLKDYDEHFADTFIFRENFVEISSAINKYRGMSSDNGIKIAESHGENTFANPNNDALNKVDVDLENEDPVTIIFKDNRALTLHKFYPEKAKSYALAINKFTNRLSQDVKVYSVLIPDQIEFIEDEEIKSMSDPQNFTIEYVNSFLSDRVTPISVYQSLKDNSDKYLYFNTDHHWTALGAYYGYSGFISALGEEPVSLDTYSTIEFKDFLGTRYALNEDLANNPDTVQIFKHPNLDEFKYYIQAAGKYKESRLLDMTFKDSPYKYGVFLGGDMPLSKIASPNKNDKKLLIVKDSYGNAFIPFVAPHFEEVYIVDPRYYDQNIYALINENSINEVLFINTISVTAKNGFPKILEALSN